MPYIAKDIEEYQYNIADDETNPDPVDDAKADAILYCIAREKGRIQDIKNQAISQIDKIQLWEVSMTRKYEKEIARQTERLQLYFLGLVASDPDLRTRELPNGTLKARKQQDELVIEDENAFVRRYKPDAMENGFINIKYQLKIDRRAIKKYIKETGDLPEGCRLDDRDDKFTITTN